MNNDLSYFYKNEYQFLSKSINLGNFIDKGALSRNQEELFTFYEDNFVNLYTNLLNLNTYFYNEKLKNKEKMIIMYTLAIQLKTSNFFHKKAADLLCRLLNEIGFTDVTHTLREGCRIRIKEAENEAKKEFFENKEENFFPYYFLTFFLTQAFRVSKIHNRLCKMRIPTLNGQDISDIYNLKSIATMIIHNQVYRFGKYFILNNYKIVIIKNKSKIPFMTSDCPIVNIYAHNNNNELKEDELEFYYPLSPKIAMTFSNNKKYINDIIEVDENDVKKYNDIIASLSEKFVYSSDKKVLDMV